jgi:hypothetical protein
MEVRTHLYGLAASRPKHKAQKLSWSLGHSDRIEKLDDSAKTLQLHKEKLDYNFCFPCGTEAPTRAMVSSFMMFLDYTQRRTRVVRSPLDEGSAQRRYNTQQMKGDRHPCLRRDSNPQSQQDSRRPTS